MKKILPILVPLFITGCSTATTVIGGANGTYKIEFSRSIPRVYSGTANNLTYCHEGNAEDFTTLIDIPFSLAADTLMLPYTIVTQAKYGNLTNTNTQ
jgi:uncharacterized protein YceK